MSFRRLLAQAIVSDPEVAERWYTALFDSSPHARPMDGLLEWHLGDSFGVQVWRDPERAGLSAMVLDESDLDALAARLTATGIQHDGPQPVTASRVLILSDPDGNHVVVTTIRSTSKDEFHPGSGRQNEPFVLVDALPRGCCTEVHSVRIDGSGPLDHVADEQGSIAVAAMLGQSDDIGEPDCSALRALGVGDSEFERADRRSDDLVLDFDYGKVSGAAVFDEAGEPRASLVPPRLVCCRGVLIEQHGPEA